MIMDDKIKLNGWWAVIGLLAIVPLGFAVSWGGDAARGFLDPIYGEHAFPVIVVTVALSKAACLPHDKRALPVCAGALIAVFEIMSVLKEMQ